MPRTIVDLPTDYFNRGAWPPTRQPSCAHLDSRPAVVLAIKPQKAHPSWALFRLLLLPPALDRPCNLLVLLSHLGEAVPASAPLWRGATSPTSPRQASQACPRSTSAALSRRWRRSPSGNDAARRCSGGDAVPRQRQFTPTHAP